MQWQRDVYDNLCERLETKEGEKDCTNWQDRETEQEKMYSTRVIKNENSNVMVNLEAVLKRWKEYFEKLMNEESNRKPSTEETEEVNEKVNCVSREEVKNALRRMKKGKAVGPNKLPVEVWKCMGKMGINFLTRLFNRLLMVEWSQKNREGVCLSQSIKTKGTHSAVETTEE